MILSETDMPRAVVYGSWDDDLGAPEAAIAVTRWRGTVSLEQEAQCVSVAYRDIPELIKALRAAHKAGEPADD